MFPFFPLRYRSHFLILLMVIISVPGFFLPWVISLFGWNPVWAPLPQVFAQLVLFQFLHGGALHLALNALFLYQAGPEIEVRMSRSRFLLFFLGSSIFIALALTLFSSGVTIGMSGFCMSLLAYLWIDLYTTKHPMANQILIMLGLNILIGFSGGISLTAHAAGAVWGLIWWAIRKKR